MPLVGGPSDKAGNSYERRWTVFALIDLLDGRAESLRIEVPGEDGVGSEFRLMVQGVPEWHQAKRQRSSGPWTISALANEGVVQPWKSHLTRSEPCVFVAGSGAEELRELAERALSAESWDEFDTQFLAAEAIRKNFDRLSRAWNDLPDSDTYLALRNIRVRTIGEPELAEWINERLRSQTQGAEPATVAAVLAQVADDSVHKELSASDVWTSLAKHGITHNDLGRDAAVVRRLAESADSFLARLRPLYIGGHELPRPEAGIAFSHLNDGKRAILAGAAGMGKSVITAQVVALARERDWPTFVVAADRLPDAPTTAQLGAGLGLPDSPATVLGSIASGRDALLVIDQLDAVSTASGRHPERLGIITDLLREARSHPGLRVLLACRRFDIDNDRSLRGIAHSADTVVVAIGELDQEQIQSALSGAGLPIKTPESLTRLLAVPLHLALYVGLAQAGAPDIQSAGTLTELYDKYWALKRDSCRLARDGTDEWLPVIEKLVRQMSDQQGLTVPEAALDEFDQQAKVMASAGVITIEHGRISFFHETFFDYCFARQVLTSGITIREVLTSSEQDLFRRAQVRQILTYERSVNFTRYVADFAWLLTSSDVRLHIKTLVIALLDTIPNPTQEEWRELRPLAENTGSPLHLRLWQALRRNAAWFPVLDDDGAWASLLRASDDLADRVIWVLTAYATDNASRVCTLLAEAPEDIWPTRRKWFLRVAEVHKARELVDLLLIGINEGDYDPDDGDLSHTLSQLAKARPEWAAEVLAALVRRAVAADDGASPFHPSGRSRVSSQELRSEARSIAAGAPGKFVDLLLPQLLDIMRTNRRPDWASTELMPDALWSHRIYASDLSLSDSLYDAMGIALAALANTSPSDASSVFAWLRGQPYESAASLLALGYVGNPEGFANEAASWLAATPGARLLGYTDSPAWISRQLVAAISPHCTSTHLDNLVDALLYYAPPHERTHEGLKSRGISELCLLNGVDPDRRSRRVDKRIAELQRKFGRDDVPPPQGFTGGVVPPPIPEERARRMTDRQWLNAMRRYGTSGTSWRNGRLIGDAWTQANVLETLTTDDPERFARLLLTIPAETSEAYISAVLRGLADARLDRNLLLEVCRHAHDFGSSDANRWLVRLIGKHSAGTVDDELVEIVVDIAATDPDPDIQAPDEITDAESIDMTALNSARGAAALAIGQLIAEETAQLSAVEPALRRLITDPRLGVRAAAIGALTPLLYSRPALALELFHEGIDLVSGPLIGSHYVERFLNRVVNQDLFSDIAPVIRSMIADSNEDTRAIGARQLAVASYHDSEVDAEVDAVLNGSDDTARAAAVGVFADNIGYTPRRDRSIAVLTSAFDDSSKSVRSAAERVFYHLDDEPFPAYETLIAAFADSPALTDDGASAALHMLESTRQPLPPTVLDVCEAFVRANQEAIGDIATGAAADATYVVRLALRMHAQYADASVRRRCLDLIDQLVAFQAHDIERHLDSIDR